MENLRKQSFDDWKQSPLKNKEEQKTGNKVANNYRFDSNPVRIGFAWAKLAAAKEPSATGGVM